MLLPLSSGQGFCSMIKGFILTSLIHNTCLLPQTPTKPLLNLSIKLWPNLSLNLSSNSIIHPKWLDLTLLNANLSPNTSNNLCPMLSPKLSPYLLPNQSIHLRTIILNLSPNCALEPQLTPLDPTWPNPTRVGPLDISWLPFDLIDARTDTVTSWAASHS
jgi:hypothetical protein